MNKVIKNRLYDTDTATLVAESNNDCCCQEDCFKERLLYRKDNGEYFMYISCSNNEWCDHEEIIPLTFDAAKEVAQEILDGTGYMKLFGIVEE